ncbi:inorganic pyrophosphatase [Candidatus Bathyarchaeota archaeon]|nr:inorganic pyrophosphatase [Candidatus Bathyarchaeota archaeon]
MTPMEFWESLDQLIREHALVIDRPRGSAHPRYPESFYPVDYGYLEGTTSSDGHGVDVWRGTLPDTRVQAVLVTVDTVKKDEEIKLVVGCTEEEIGRLYPYTESYSMASIIVRRE